MNFDRNEIANTREKVIVLSAVSFTFISTRSRFGASIKYTSAVGSEEFRKEIRKQFLGL